MKISESKLKELKKKALTDKDIIKLVTDLVKDLDKSEDTAQAISAITQLASELKSESRSSDKRIDDLVKAINKKDYKVLVNNTIDKSKDAIVTDAVAKLTEAIAVLKKPCSFEHTIYRNDDGVPYKVISKPIKTTESDNR